MHPFQEWRKKQKEVSSCKIQKEHQKSRGVSKRKERMKRGHLKLKTRFTHWQCQQENFGHERPRPLKSCFLHIYYTWSCSYSRAALVGRSVSWPKWLSSCVVLDMQISLNKQGLFYPTYEATFFVLWLGFLLPRYVKIRPGLSFKFWGLLVLVFANLGQGLFRQGVICLPAETCIFAICDNVIADADFSTLGGEICTVPSKMKKNGCALVKHAPQPNIVQFKCCTNLWQESNIYGSNNCIIG